MCSLCPAGDCFQEDFLTWESGLRRIEKARQQDRSWAHGSLCREVKLRAELRDTTAAAGMMLMLMDCVCEELGDHLPASPQDLAVPLRNFWGWNSLSSGKIQICMMALILKGVQHYGSDQHNETHTSNFISFPELLVTSGKLITEFQTVPGSLDLALMAYVILTSCLYCLCSFQSLKCTEKNEGSGEEVYVYHMTKCMFILEY